MNAAPNTPRKFRSVLDFHAYKSREQKISMVTCYDAAFAQLIAKTDVDTILVGDSLAMAVYGRPNTLGASVAEMARHTEAVRRGAFDFLLKPVSIDTVLQALRRAQLFAREEAYLVLQGQARLHITARMGEGPKEAGAQAEEQLLRRAFAGADYNVAETARQLGLAREHVYYYLNKYGIQRPG